MNHSLQGAQLREFIDTSNSEEALALLQEHTSELLTDAAIADLKQWRDEEANNDRQKRLDERLQMLKEAKGWRDWWEQASPAEQLFARFLYTEHADDMMALALNASPEELDELDELDELENIAEAESAKAEGDEAEAIRERLAILRELREPGGGLEQARTLIDKLIEWMKAPDGAASEAYLQQHANELLTDQAQAMLELLLRMNDNNAQMQWLLGLLARCHELGIAEAYAELRNSSEAAEEPTLNPVQQAVLEFLEAETDAAARELLAVNDSPLLTLDARRLLESYVEASGQQNAELRARLEARLALWHKVRLGPKPEVVQPPSTPPPELITSGRPGELEFQVPGKAKYWIIEASHCAIGDNAQTLNILNVGRVPLQWQKPQQFRTDLTESAVGRIDELNDLHERLQSGASAAVVGKGISRGASGAVRGIPGVGKSTLAALYAEQYAEHYPGGVIWLQLGPSYTTAESVGPVISELAAFAYSGDVQAYRALSLAQPATTPEQALASLKHAIFKPEAVKLLLSGHGPLLIIVDDVWDKAVLKTIRAARPHDASLLVTTRDSRVANQVGNALELDVLSEDDALAMIDERLPGMEVLLAKHLAEVVGYHPLALEIALGDLVEQDQEDWPDCTAKISRLVDTGESLDFLPLSDDTDREQKLAAVLRYSYDALGQRTEGEWLQCHFRALGTFAREADFATAAVAMLWQIDEKPAKEHLLVFRARSLLSGRSGQWRQHSMLRSYALSLQDNSERLQWAERHAEYYLARMREADNENQFYRMAPELPNLRHVFDWAVQEGLGLAQDLLGYSADLLRSQNLGEEYLAWAQRVLDRARHIGGNEEIGHAFNSLGNALQAAATLIYGKDRGARLREALAAYEEALARCRDVPLQYAPTQNNRALLLRDLAGLPGEDRGARLREALAAYEEALALRRDVPLDYAQTQNNRALLLRDLAGLPGEDRGARLREALAAAIQAVELFEQYQHAEYLRVGRQTLAGVIVTLGASEARAFLQALCPEKPLPPLTQGELLEVLAWQEGIQTEEEWQSRFESDADFQARVTELMAFVQNDEATKAAAAAQLIAERLVEWIKTPDLQHSQAYLEEHAGILLTDAGEVVLQRLLENNDNNPTIAQYLALLQCCREIGIPETYREIEAQDD